jgi:hypothetical protein
MKSTTVAVQLGCKFTGCGQLAFGAGWCRRHYIQFNKVGRENMSPLTPFIDEGKFIPSGR